MGFNVLRCFEYGFFCDNPSCSDWETLHTGDSVNGLFVHNTETAFKVAKYHRVKGKTYCDKCFREYIIGRSGKKYEESEE